MSTVANLLTSIGYNLSRTISATSDPTETQYITSINEVIDLIVQVLAQNRSEIGRTLGSISCAESAITAITQANPGSVTSTAHGFDTDDVVTISGVVGMTEVNDTDFTITKVDANTYTIGVDTSSYTAYSSGGYGYMAEYDDFASTLYAVGVMVDDHGNEFSGWIEKTYDRPTLKLVTEASRINYQPGQNDEPEAFYLTGDNNIVFLPTPDDDYTIKIPYYALQTISATTDTVPFKNLFDNLIIETVTARYLHRMADEQEASAEWNWFKFVHEKVMRILSVRRQMPIKVV